MAMRFFLVMMLATAALSPAQTRVVPQTFDVVSIKPNLTGSVVHRATTLHGGVFTATNVSLESLMSRAFGVVEAQIEGGPRWIGSDEYDVEARANTTGIRVSRNNHAPLSLPGMLSTAGQCDQSRRFVMFLNSFFRLSRRRD
jgi:hypothetical protein